MEGIHIISIKEIKKIENYSKEEKIEFYENLFSLIELGTATVYEYKEIFGLYDVEDKYILREIKNVIEKLTVNYRSLFENGNLPENYIKNQTKIRNAINKEVNKIISYLPTINNLPISVGYFDRKNNTEVIYEIKESDIQTGIYEVYKNNEYICARTVKESILRQLKQISNKSALLAEYQKLSEEEKIKIEEMATTIPCNFSETAKAMIVNVSSEQSISSINCKFIGEKRKIKGQTKDRPSQR